MKSIVITGVRLIVLVMVCIAIAGCAVRPRFRSRISSGSNGAALIQPTTAAVNPAAAQPQSPAVSEIQPTATIQPAAAGSAAMGSDLGQTLSDQIATLDTANQAGDALENVP